MTSKHEKLAERLASILIELNTYGMVDIKALVDRFNIGERTLQKDLNERLAFLNWEKSGPRYYSLNRNQLGIFNQDDINRFARFASIQDLFPKLDREFFQNSLNESIKVNGLQYESIYHRQIEFKQLQQAIKNHQIISFHYRKYNQETSQRIVEPYLLVNRNGIWYLIALENGKEKTFCFNQISFLNITKQIFTPNENLLAEIKKSDSISHGNQLDEVIIKVNAQVARYFSQRVLLPNQEIIRHIENGELLISCKNIHEMEIIPTVQYWLPHLVIISPTNLQEKMIDKLKRSRDFTTIYNKSRKVYTRYAIVFVSENKNCMQRFGFVASKKTGNAVQRNRIKRLFREFVKNNKEKFKEGTDYIFVGKAVLKEKLASLKYEDIEKDMLKVIKK